MAGIEERLELVTVVNDVNEARKILDITEKLNIAIEQKAQEELGSSTTYLLRYGQRLYVTPEIYYQIDPDTQPIITKEGLVELFPNITLDNLKKLKAREENLKDIYYTSIMPKLASIVRALCRCKTHLGESDSKVRFEQTEEAEIKKYLLKRLEAQHIWVDEKTHNNLLNGKSDKETKHVFYAREGTKLYAYRMKMIESIKRKLGVVWDYEITVDEKGNPRSKTDEEKRIYAEFVLEVTKDDKGFWKDRVTYKSFYGNNVKMMLYDIFAFSEIETVQAKAEKHIRLLDSDYKTRDCAGISLVLYKNHAKRQNQPERPAGRHIIYVDDEHSNFPFEVKALTLLDEVYYLSGEHSDKRYRLQKKANETYRKNNTDV